MTHSITDGPSPSSTNPSVSTGTKLITSQSFTTALNLRLTLSMFLWMSMPAHRLSLPNHVVAHQNFVLSLSRQRNISWEEYQYLEAPTKRVFVTTLPPYTFSFIAINFLKLSSTGYLVSVFFSSNSNRFIQTASVSIKSSAHPHKDHHSTVRARSLTSP